MANNIFNTIIQHTNSDAVKAICSKTKLEYRKNGRYTSIEAGTLKSIEDIMSSFEETYEELLKYLNYK
jgi:hypothetical protein